MVTTPCQILNWTSMWTWNFWITEKIVDDSRDCLTTSIQDLCVRCKMKARHQKSSSWAFGISFTLYLGLVFCVCTPYLYIVSDFSSSVRQLSWYIDTCRCCSISSIYSRKILSKLGGVHNLTNQINNVIVECSMKVWGKKKVFKRNKFWNLWYSCQVMG
jgi:hypothetical protein